MKKTILTLTLSVLAFSNINALTPKVSVGFTLPNETYTAADGTTVRGIYQGIYLGGGCEFPFNDVLGMEVDLFFYNYGTRRQAFNLIRPINDRYTSNGLLLPVYLYGSFDVGRNSEFSIHIGPFANLGLSSKHDGIDDYRDNSDWSRLNAGISAGLGITFASRYEIYAGYNWGLVDLHKSGVYKARASFFELGFSYCFELD